jgi:hypothetical protein
VASTALALTLALAGLPAQAPRCAARPCCARVSRDGAISALVRAPMPCCQPLSTPRLPPPPTRGEPQPLVTIVPSPRATPVAAPPSLLALVARTRPCARALRARSEKLLL